MSQEEGEARYVRTYLLLQNVCPFILRKVIDNVAQQKKLNTYHLLDYHKHDIFHLLYQNCCCGKSSRATPMNKSQWNLIYVKNSSCCCRGHRGICPCQYDTNQSITAQDMDVTLCCLIIQNICKGINMAHIETIRDVRNRLAHAKNAYLDNQTFCDYWTKVKIALTKLAVYVSKEAKEEVDEKIDELENRVMNTKVLEEMRNLICDEKRFGEMEQELINLTAEVSKVNEKVTEVKETTEKTTNKVALMERQLDNGIGSTDIKVKELRTLIIDINDSEASGIQILPLKTDHTVDLDSIYVPVSITDETGTRNSNSSSSDDVRNVTSEKMFFVQPDKPARFVFMLGDAGFGKTLHCQRMTKLWCQVWKNENETSKNQYQDPNLAGCLKQFDFLFFVQLHDVHCESISLIEIIQDVYSRYRLSKERLDNIRWVLEGEAYSSLVLLDGLDEWNISKEKRKILLDKCIPNCRDMPKSTILISMRSWKFMEVEQICRPKVDRVIRLHGISEDNIPQLSRKMLCNYFKKDSESEEFQNFQTSVSSASNELRSLMRIPLLAIFCFFSFLEDVSTGYSLTTFYLSMIEALFKRHFTKLQTGLNLREERYSSPTIPSISMNYPYLAKHMTELSNLGKVAFENLTSQDTSLDFGRERLHELIGEDTLDLFLRIGLVIKKQTTGKFYEDNIRILFLHKTIQEFLSALYLFNMRDDTQILACLACKVRDIPKALEFSSILVLLSGLSSSVGCGISNLIKELADKDEDICTYRINFQYKSYQKVFYLYNLQLRCYREVRETKSVDTFVGEGHKPKFTFSDVILLSNDSDKLTVRESISVLQFHANDIKSLNMICIPDSNVDGVPNEVIKTFLDESRSVESFYIDGYVRGKCRLFNDSIRISHLQTLGLANVAFSSGNLTEFLTTEASMKGIRSLALLHLKPPDDLDVGYRYQLPSIHWISTNKSGFIRKACSLPPEEKFVWKEKKIPLVKNFLEILPKFQNLSIFYITYLEAPDDRQMLLDVLPELNNLEALHHFGYYGSFIHQEPNEAYDSAVISCILKLQKLRFVILRQISLSENIMKFGKLSNLEVIWLAMFEMKSTDWKDFMRSIPRIGTLHRIGLIDTNIEDEMFQEYKKSFGSLCVEKFETTNW